MASMTRPRQRDTPRLAMTASVALMVALVAYVAWLAPVQGDDWSMLLWQHRHGGSVGALLSLVAHGRTVPDLTGYLRVTVPWTHAVLTSISWLAIILGVWKLTRPVRAVAWSDVGAFWLISALLWIGAPRLAVIVFHRSSAAMFIDGTALMLWFVIAVQALTREQSPRRWAGFGMFLFGLVAAATTRQLGAVALITYAWIWFGRRGDAVLPRRVRISAWCGLLIGTVSTWLHFVVGPLHIVGSGRMILMTFTECGELIALTILLILGHRGLQALRARPAVELNAGMLAVAGGWAGVAILAAAIGLLGPWASEPALFAPVVLLTIAVTPILVGLAADSWARAFVIAMVVVIHAVVAVKSVATYRRAAEESAARLAVLSAAPPDSVATIAPSWRIEQTFWWYGEDLVNASYREDIAQELFGLRDIEFLPSFRQMERSAGLEVVAHWSSASVEQLAHATMPHRFGRSLQLAREQLDRIIEALASSLRGWTGELAVTNHDFAELHGRPLLTSLAVPAGSTNPVFHRLPVDDLNRTPYKIEMSGPQAKSALPGAGDEVYVVQDHQAHRVTADADATYRYSFDRPGIFLLVVCGAQRCMVVDVIAPRL